MIHYILLPGYIPATCHKNNIVKLLAISVLYYRNFTCLLGHHYLHDGGHGVHSDFFLQMPKTVYSSMFIYDFLLMWRGKYV